MLNVNTLPNKEKMKNLLTSTTLNEDERRKTKQRRSKEQKKVKKRFQNKCVSSQNQNVRRWRYRSGYTYLLFGKTVRAVSCGPDGQRSP